MTTATPLTFDDYVAAMPNRNPDVPFGVLLDCYIAAVHPIAFNAGLYSFNHEWSGEAHRPIVVRFVGHPKHPRIGSARTREAALAIAHDHHDQVFNHKAGPIRPDLGAST